MTGQGGLAGRRVLVLEDEYYLAQDLADTLAGQGASVIGPFRDADDAMAALDAHSPEMALVDINLGSGPSFDLPRRLAAAGIPFAFITGYDRSALPAEFADVPRLEKPIDAPAIIRLIATLA